MRNRSWPVALGGRGATALLRLHEHWADGGKTKLSNLITLCRAHHRMVHTGDIAIETLADGTWRFSNQTGAPFDGAYREDAPPYDWTELRAVHDAADIAITPETATTRWAGEVMDYDLALVGLFNQRERFRGNVGKQ